MLQGMMPLRTVITASIAAYENQCAIAEQKKSLQRPLRWTRTTSSTPMITPRTVRVNVLLWHTALLVFNAIVRAACATYGLRNAQLRNVAQGIAHRVQPCARLRV